MPLHHLMIGTWTPPGAIFTVQFDDENLTLKLVKRTEIPHDEPISWMAFDVCQLAPSHQPMASAVAAIDNVGSTQRRTSTVPP